MIRRAVALALLVACSSSSYAEQNGTESGPCYPNGTCNEGLTCASNRCVRVDGGVTDAGPTDGSSSNAANDAAPNDASTRDAFAKFDASACYPPTTAPKIECGNAPCGTGDKCCAGSTSACTVINSACANGSKPIACLTSSQCTDAEVCCAQGDVVFGQDCPVLVNNVLQTTCKASCGIGEVRLCSGFASDTCGQGTCIAGTLEGSPGGNSSVGVCFGD